MDSDQVAGLPAATITLQSNSLAFWPADDALSRPNKAARQWECSHTLDSCRDGIAADIEKRTVVASQRSETSIPLLCLTHSDRISFSVTLQGKNVRPAIPAGIEKDVQNRTVTWNSVTKIT
jgi:hypothetical protein